MVSHNPYQSELDRSPTYMTGRSYQSQFYQRQSYQNQPSYANQSGIARACHRGNPQMNYTACGAAFTALPAELGGKPSGTERFVQNVEQISSITIKRRVVVILTNWLITGHIR